MGRSVKTDNRMWERRKAQKYHLIVGKALKLETEEPNVNVRGAKRRMKALKDFKRRLTVAKVLSYSKITFSRRDTRTCRGSGQPGSGNDCAPCERKNNLVTKAWLRAIVLHPFYFCSALTRILSMLKT